MNKEILFMTANRNGYAMNQCGETLTVGELIGFLQEFNEDTPIFLTHDNRYTYGSISENDFELEYVGEEE